MKQLMKCGDCGAVLEPRMQDSTLFIDHRCGEALQRDRPDGTWCWTPTSVALPKNTEACLFYAGAGTIFKGYYIPDTGSWYESGDDFPLGAKVSHWMPLPPSPTDTEESKP